MNLLLIKIGKAWHTLRREGLLRGGRRVMTAGLALFRRVRPGDILFITGGVGDSARYRTEHVAEVLRKQGWSVATTVQDNPFLSTYASQFSIFIFHRVLFTPSVATLIERIKKENKEIIFETDDLVYDPEYLKHMDYFTQMNALERKLYEHGVGGEILADSYVTTCTTSTEYLAEKLREKKKQVFVVRNRLSTQDVAWANEIIENKKSSLSTHDASLIRIAYFSGTASHNKDFAVITPVLARLLDKYREVRLVLAGPLDVTSVLNQYASQIERIPFSPRQEHFANIASVDINVAPLEIGNPFCESKSELKWFEAGIVGVPTVASATAPFREAITDGVDGYVAMSEAEWQEKLEKLITDETARQVMGENARQTALARYTTESANDTEYYEYLQSKIRA
ncbi:MAG: glycosyltransferase [Candidatus Moranbacteria bacterium]|nr:glycosyltransferase [Candidatus Moranbacteria bacterium]